MRSRRAKRRVVIRSAILLVILISGLPSTPGWAVGHDPVEVTKRYLQAVYARDYRTAYRYISERDRQAKREEEYLRENPSFTGAALELSRTLAGEIEWNQLQTKVEGDSATMRLTIRLPNANAPALQQLLLDFDPDRLASLSGSEVQTIAETIRRMGKQGALPMVDVRDRLQLVREQGRWGVFVNWAGAISIHFQASVKAGLPWKFWPVQETILAKPGETLQAMYKAKNLSNVPITAKAIHVDEPQETAAKYLEIIQCFCFIQQTLAPGEEQEFPLVFRVNWDVPESVREFRITYAFYPIDKFPEKLPQQPD